jgi:hypothetical protein
MRGWRNCRRLSYVAFHYRTAAMDTFRSAYRIFNENEDIWARRRAQLDELGRRSRVQDRVFQRQLQGRAGRNRRRQDHPQLSAGGRHRCRRHGGGIGDPRFRQGDDVICTSYDMGVAHDGGYAGYCRVPADWVVPLPQGLTPVRSHGARHRRVYRRARGLPARAERHDSPATARCWSTARPGAWRRLRSTCSPGSATITAVTGKDGTSTIS